MPSDDHAEQAVKLDSCGPLRFFASLAPDRLLKVWDRSGTLYSASRGEESTGGQEDEEDDDTCIPFNDDADVLRTYLRNKALFEQGRRFECYREAYGEHLFWTLDHNASPEAIAKGARRRPRPTVNSGTMLKANRLSDSAFGDLVARIKVLTQRRLRILASAKLRMEEEQKKISEQDSRGDITVLKNESQLELFYSFDLRSPIEIENADRLDDEIDSTDENSWTHEAVVPNSIMSRKFREFGVAAFQSEGARRSRLTTVSTAGKRAGTTKSASSNTHAASSEGSASGGEQKLSFLERLKKAMEEQEEKAAKIQASHRHESNDKVAVDDPEDGDDGVGARAVGALPRVIRPIHMDLPGTAPPPKYHRLIERALAYEWFPQEEIFYPESPAGRDVRGGGPPAASRGTPAKPLRNLRIEPTGEGILPVVLDAFRRERGNAARSEMLGYLAWVHEDLGFRDTTALVRFLCRYLQSPPFVDVEEEEMEVRLQAMDMMPSLGFQQLEILPSLLMQAVQPLEKLRVKAKELLATLGIFEDAYPFIAEKVVEIFTEHEQAFTAERVDAAAAAARAASRATQDPTAKSAAGAPRIPQLGSGVASLVTPGDRTRSVGGGANVAVGPPVGPSAAGLEFRNGIMTWLRRVLRRHLLRTARDDETVARLRELNDSGLVDRGGKKALEDKEKEDAKALLQRERDRAKLRVREEDAAVAAAAGGKAGTDAAEADRYKKGGGATTPGAGKKRKVKVVRPDMLERRTSKQIIKSRQRARRAKQQEAVDEGERPTSASSVLIVLERMGGGSATAEGGAAAGGGRSQVTTLQNPGVADFVAAANCVGVGQARRAERERRERAEREAREAEAAERARVERERREAEQAAAQEFTRRREDERAERAEAMRRRLAERRAEREAAEEAAEAEARRRARLRGGGAGGLPARKSKCHASRETADYLLMLDHPHVHENVLTMHLLHLGRAMPVDNKRLAPFGENAFASDDDIAGPARLLSTGEMADGSGGGGGLRASHAAGRDAADRREDADTDRTVLPQRRKYFVFS
ncbi:hypothetical protein HK405_008807 [Cladochytrium tenue]|nr:hypothetical protein HK405_008807 [Cladochytrium tenue]